MRSLKSCFFKHNWNICLLWIRVILSSTLLISLIFYNNVFNYKIRYGKSHTEDSFNLIKLRNLSEYNKNYDEEYYDILKLNIDNDKLKKFTMRIHPEVELFGRDSEYFGKNMNEVYIKLITDLKPDLINVNATSKKELLNEWDFIMNNSIPTNDEPIVETNNETDDDTNDGKIIKKKKKRRKPRIRYIAELVGYGTILIAGFPVILSLIVIGGFIWCVKGTKAARKYFSAIKKFLFAKLPF
ncbi:exported protein (hyp9) [Plasmodium gaboni]|uniref:Exported protein (Hyp9) n=1 Tax=Plasmodium gaboni TaxID=647221 RepID=A0A151LW82_9APIC|nr:exported protein (hyp9) [Plasmodium gaboni]KYO03449.1 exported protein (hyp9) [Plasmodium gaboni]